MAVSGVARAGGGFYEWSGAIETSARALADGDLQRAEASARAALAALPQGQAGARANLALGLALDAEGKAQDAVEPLRIATEAFQADLGFAAPAGSYYADALVKSGKPGLASQVYDAVSASDGPLADRAGWRRADALLAAGAFAPAAEQYERKLAAAPNAVEAPAARVALAQALRKLGKPDDAVEQLRVVWRDFPADPAAAAAEGAFQPDASERLDRAERLVATGRDSMAVEELDRFDAMKPPAALAAQGEVLRALALLALGRREEAETLAKKVRADEDAPGEARAGAVLVLARAAARAGRVDEASALYKKVAADPPTELPGLPPNLPDESLYLAAWLYFDSGQYAKAVPLLDRFAKTHKKSRRYEDARWYRAWSLRKLGRAAEAKRAFLELAHGPAKAQALYWAGRGEARKDAAAADFGNAWLADRFGCTGPSPSACRGAEPRSSAGWYALLAESRLAQLGRKPPAFECSAPSRSARRRAAPGSSGPPCAEPQPIALEGDPDPGISRALAELQLGLRADAAAELAWLARTRKVPAPALAQLCAEAGVPEVAYRLAADRLAPTTRAQRYGYPEAFPEFAPRRARGFGIDPYMLLAVMRQESGFVVHARSDAAAQGLMQLIEPTALRLATILGVDPALAERLDDPETNASFGAYYLALLVARFGDPAVAIAAYNAGPAPAAQWAKAAVGKPLDEWVEDISYRQTRGYVKQVVAQWATYRRLYGAGPLAVDAGRKIAAPGAGVGF